MRIAITGVRPFELALWLLVVVTIGTVSAAVSAPADACLEVQLTPAHVARVIDGDTFILYAVGVPPEERIRVLGVDAPELRDSLGPRARVFTIGWLSDGPFTIATCRRDSFGRYLAAVTRGATDTLAVDLIRAGLGVRR